MLFKFKRQPLAAVVGLVVAGGMQTPVALAESVGLEEVIVTAQKREQSLQQTSIAVTALSSQQIETLRIRNIDDISLHAPNVEIVKSPTNGTSATVAIRGATQINPALTWENSVGVYLDGVFMGKNLGGVFDIADLERVEVLRGPQGTLYGKNTVGGALNLVTRKPSGEFSGNVRVEAGNYGLWGAGFTMDTPKVGPMAVTVSSYREKRDGFYDNVADPKNNIFATGGIASAASLSAAPAPSSDDFANSNTESYRAAFLFDLHERLDIGLTYDYNRQNLNPQLGQLTQTGSNSFLSAPPFLGQDRYLTGENERASRGSNDFSFVEKSRLQGLSWYADIDVSDSIQFKYIGSKRDMQWDDMIDIDGSPIDLFHSERHVDYTQVSHEIQMIGNTETTNYVLGLYSFKEDGDVGNPITFFGVFGTPTANNRYGLDNKSTAVFGQMDWTPSAAGLNNQLTLTFGLRWTKEQKRQSIDHPGDFSGDASDSWTNTSPTLTGTWAFNDNVNTYVRVAQGWKSGGFNGEASSLDRFEKSYDPETVTAYEWGLKSQWMDNRLQTNIAAFYNDISDVQLSVFEGAAAASLVVNVPKAVTKGFELEMVGLITDNLRMNFNWGYLLSSYREWPDNLAFDKEEAGFPYAPRNTANLGLDWTIVQGGFGNLDFHIDWNFTDDYTPFIDPDQVETSQIKNYQVWNARLSLTDIPVGEDMAFRVSLWGKNLTDTEYRVNTIPFGGVDQRVDPMGGNGVGWTTSYFGEPRTFGVEARFDF